MTEPLGSTTNPSISDELVHVVARALVREQTQGLCDENYPNPCDGCDCDFDTGKSMMIGYAQQQARVILAAAVPLIERQLREKIAAEIDARDEFWGFPGKLAIADAARVARGETT